MNGTDGHRTTRSGRRWAAITGHAVVGLVSALILGVSGYTWAQYHSLSQGITKSDVLASGTAPTATSAATKPANPDSNILIMGLDTRLDENGDPLPADLYNALHAGDQTVGGNNSNVLMLLHVPGDGSRATSISIPRDDYVSLPGCPDDECMGKIKQAYGLAFDQESRAIPAGTDKTQREQRQRDAGRKAEIATVSQFLGGVTINHFVEVTLVAFFQLAQVVQPVTVCLNQATQDSFSGADFRPGQQQITASQALAFVRQRRDTVHPELNFTDLDRERRQQAFIASLAFQLKQAGTFTDPTKLSSIIQVAKDNIAIDSGLDLLSFAQQAANLTDGAITFFTLPIDHFGTDPLGEDVNFVDLPLIQSTVRHLLAGPSSTTTSTPSASASNPPSSLDSVAAASSTTPPPASAVPVTGGESASPPPTVLSALSGGGIPCVA